MMYAEAKGLRVSFAGLGLALSMLAVDPLGVVIVLALLGVVVFVLGKLKLLATVLAILAAFLVGFLIMSAVPPLRVEPVYSMLKDFFTNLPNYLNMFVDYVKRLLGLAGGLAGGGAAK